MNSESRHRAFGVDDLAAQLEIQRERLVFWLEAAAWADEKFGRTNAAYHHGQVASVKASIERLQKELLTAMYQPELFK